MSKKSIKVHPLVIVSACDHHTRVAVGGSLLTKDSPTIGLLFGSVTSGKDEDGSPLTSVDIIDATDAVYSYDSSTQQLSLDMKQLKNKRDLWVRVYPTQPLLGWYCVAAEVTSMHLQIHREISSLMQGEEGEEGEGEEGSSSSSSGGSRSSRDAVMLMMNPIVDSGAKQLPILLFELQQSMAQEVFVELPFKLESSPIESVVMDKVITSNPPEGVSPVEVQNEGLLVSLRALLAKVDVIVHEVERMQAGEVPVNYELLRKAAKICNLLPTSGLLKPPPLAAQEGIAHDVTDSLTLSMLGVVAANLRQLQAVHGAYHQAGYGDRDRDRGGIRLR